MKLYLDSKNSVTMIHLPNRKIKDSIKEKEILWTKVVRSVHGSTIFEEMCNIRPIFGAVVKILGFLKLDHWWGGRL